MVLNHGLVNSPGSRSLPQLDIRHHQVLLVLVLEHVSQITLELCPEQESSCNLLNLDDLLPSLIKVDFDVVPGPIAPIQALYQDTRTISLEYSPQSIDVDL